MEGMRLLPIDLISLPSGGKLCLIHKIVLFIVQLNFYIKVPQLS